MNATMILVKENTKSSLTIDYRFDYNDDEALIVDSILDELPGWTIATISYQ